MCNVKMEALKVFLDRWSQNNNNFFSQFKKTVQNNKTRLYDLKYLYDYALESFNSKPKTFVSTGFDKEKNRFTQVLMKFN